MKSKIKAFFGRTIDKRGLLPSIFFACLAAFCLAPRTAELHSFHRIIGISVVEGIDVSARMLRFFTWYLLIIPIAFLIGCILTGTIIKRYEKEADKRELTDCLCFIRDLSIVGLAAEAMALINRFSITKSDQLVLLLAMFVFAFGAIFVYGTTYRLHRISFGDFKLLLFAAFTFYISSSLFLNGRKPLYFTAAVFAVSFITFWIAHHIHKRDQIAALSKYGLLVFSFFPAAAALFVELTNILNQYNIFVNRKKLCLAIIFAAFALIAFLISVIRRHIKAEIPWERVVYPALVIGILLIANLPSLQTVVSTDLFEQANHGMLTYDLFAYGKVPIIESFDGHMLNYSWTGIIYGLLNSDIIGASFIPYNGLNYVVLGIIAYFLLARFFGRDFALLSVLFIPYPLNVSFGVVSVLALLKATEKNTFSRWLVFWISLVAVTLYEFPQGVSFGVGTVVTVIVLFVVSCKKPDVKNVLTSLAVTLASFAVIFFGICLIKNIPVFERVKEFLALLASNVNWAYPSLGDPSLFAYALVYVLMPLTMLGLFIYTVYRLRTTDDKAIHAACIAEIALVAAYFTNFSRALGRHCVWEMKIELCLWTAPLALALFFSILKPKIKLQAFTVVTISAAIIITLTRTNTNYKNNASVIAAVDRINSGIVAADTDSKVQRVVLSDGMKQTTGYITEAIRVLMPEEDETYIDFTAQTLLYALSGKEKPVYINQSPLHLSGEYTQEAFLREVQEKNCVFALTAFNTELPLYALDDVYNNYRYYKVSEYIWSNYTPVAAAKGYAFLCRNDKLDEMKARIEAAISSGKVKAIDKDDFSRDLHDYKLGKLPYLWGNYDVKKAHLNPVIQKADGSTLKIQEAFDKSKGNYIMLDISSESDTTATVVMSRPNDKELCRFTFHVQEGDAKYLIRISADMYWYTEDEAVISVRPGSNNDRKVNFTVRAVSVLEGD